MCGMILTFYFVVAVSLSLLSGDSRAEKIEVVTETLQPFQFITEKGALSGASVEIVDALFKITQDKYSTSLLPWARAYLIALNTPDVMIYSIARTADREHKFHWIGKIKTERFYFWRLNSNDTIPIRSLEQLKTLTVAASNSYNSAAFLEKNNFLYFYKLVKDSQSLGMLFKKRVDLILSTELVIQKNAERLNLDLSKIEKILEVTELNNELSIAFSLGTEPNTLIRFRSAYAQLVNSGELGRIRKKWAIEDDE